MKDTRRQRFVLLGTGLALLLLVAALVGLTRQGFVAAQSRQDAGSGIPTTDQGGPTTWPALPTQTVPRVQLPSAPAGTLHGSTRAVQFHALTAPVPVMDMNLAGALLAPDAETPARRPPAFRMGRARPSPPAGPGGPITPM